MFEVQNLIKISWIDTSQARGSSNHFPTQGVEVSQECFFFFFTIGFKILGRMLIATSLQYGHHVISPSETITTLIIGED